MRGLKENLDELEDCKIVCSCEGAAEQAIMDILLDNDCLMFNRDDLVRREITRKRKAAEIKQEFLNLDYSPHKVNILRIHDSRSERFNLGPIYEERHRVFSIRTTPEIEMILIIAEKKDTAYRKQSKSNRKPSEYCKIDLKLGNDIKSYDFWVDYFSDIDKLLDVLRRYHQTRSDKDELGIYDLLKKEYQ